MAKQIPMLYSTPMVRAILDDTKSETRRILKMEKNFAKGEKITWGYTAFTPPGHISVRGVHRFKVGKNKYKSEYGESFIKCPYGSVGDVIWVRESFSVGRASGLFYYKLHNDGSEHQCVKNYKSFFDRWKPSIHMPKKAARIWLKITSITVERLNDISEKDAIAEGIIKEYSPMFQEIRYRDYLNDDWWRDPRSSYESLWKLINGLDSWKENPWVWVVKFKRTEKPL